MNRFFILRPDIHDHQITFPDEVAHQLKCVLRMKTGDQVVILDNQDHEWLVELILSKEHVLGKILDQNAPPLEPESKISLIFSLTQRAKVELILQKCTEIGVSSFVPFVSSRSLVRVLDEVETKRIRWEKIIQESAEQSNRSHLPELHSAVGFEQAVQQYDRYDFPLLAWENENRNYLNTILPPKQVNRIGLMVGPEGGFEETEIHFAIKHKWIPVTLGKRILRMETAAIVGSALILNILGE